MLRRSKEYKKFLSRFFEKKKTVSNYACYCNTAERVLGRDLDDVVCDFNEIAKALASLAAEPSYVRKAFEYYISFYYAPKQSWADSDTEGEEKPGDDGDVAKNSHQKGTIMPIPKKISFEPLVQYYSDVPSVERDEDLRAGLELEYPKILAFAQKTLGALVDPDLHYIPVFLSKETPFSKPVLVDKRYINRLKRNYEKGKELTQDQLAILDGGMIRSEPIVASFFEGEAPYIEIYYNNIYCSKSHNLTFAIMYLAHEYMHFLHYSYVAQRGIADPLNIKKLNEAMADFFGVIYSMDLGGKDDKAVAQRRYEIWLGRDGSGWPYAYALKFFNKPYKYRLIDYSSIQTDNAIQKLKNVFAKTTDPKEAFKLLNS